MGREVIRRIKCVHVRDRVKRLEIGRKGQREGEIIKKKERKRNCGMSKRISVYERRRKFDRCLKERIMSI